MGANLRGRPAMRSAFRQSGGLEANSATPGKRTFRVLRTEANRPRAFRKPCLGKRLSFWGRRRGSVEVETGIFGRRLLPVSGGQGAAVRRGGLGAAVGNTDRQRQRKGRDQGGIAPSDRTVWVRQAAHGATLRRASSVTHYRPSDSKWTSREFAHRLRGDALGQRHERGFEVDLVFLEGGELVAGFDEQRR